MHGLGLAGVDPIDDGEVVGSTHVAWRSSAPDGPDIPIAAPGRAPLGPARFADITASWDPSGSTGEDVDVGVMQLDVRPGCTAWDLREELHASGRTTRAGVPPGPSGQLVSALAEAIADLCHERYGFAFTTLRRRRLAINPPGLSSTGFNPVSGRFMGLHYDWFDDGSADRAEVTLLVANLGRADRYISFVPRAALRARNAEVLPATEAECTATPRRVLRDHPDIDVLTVRQPPFDVYVARTATVIHDGRTNDEGETDLALFVAGDRT